jgi:hypothetical protein
MEGFNSSKLCVFTGVIAVLVFEHCAWAKPTCSEQGVKQCTHTETQRKLLLWCVASDVTSAPLLMQCGQIERTDKEGSMHATLAEFHFLLI